MHKELLIKSTSVRLCGKQAGCSNPIVACEAGKCLAGIAEPAVMWNKCQEKNIARSSLQLKFLRNMHVLFEFSTKRSFNRLILACTRFQSDNQCEADSREND